MPSPTPPPSKSSRPSPPLRPGWALSTHSAHPHFRTLLADHLTPVTAYERLAAADRAGADHAFLLESVVGGERIARYSFLATNPRTLIKASRHKRDD